MLMSRNHLSRVAVLTMMLSNRSCQSLMLMRGSLLNKSGNRCYSKSNQDGSFGFISTKKRSGLTTFSSAAGESPKTASMSNDEPFVEPKDRPALDALSVRPESPGAAHPCLSCGACCAFFRASFPFMEVSARGLDEDSVDELIFPYVAFKGTTRAENKRCVNLAGSLGQFGTACKVYDQRPSCCRDFLPSFEDGLTRNERCDRARAAHALPPLRVEDWSAYNANP